MTGSVAITMNSQPRLYTVTGGGSLCSGSAGVAVGLSDSQTGVSYQLKAGSSNAGSAVAGTGSIISFGLQTTAATYTVVATNSTTFCTATMTGSVTVTVLALPDLPRHIDGSKNVCAGRTTSLTDNTDGGVWSSSDITVATVSNRGVVTGIKEGTTTIYYTLTNRNGCTNSVSTIFTVNPLAAQPGYFTSYATDVRRGRSNVSYTVPPVDGITYAWSYSGRGATIFGTTNSVKVSFSSTATPGTLSVTASNNCGTSQARTIAILLNNNDSKSDTLVVINPPVNPIELNLTREFKVYPNPSSGPAIFEFRIGENAWVMLDIYSINGQHMAHVYEGDVEAGIPQTALFEQYLPTGVYACVLSWKGKITTLKFVVTH